MANELCDFFMKIKPSMRRNSTFRRQILNVAADFRPVIVERPLKATKQEKKIYYKSWSKCDNDINIVEQSFIKIAFFLLIL